ncbi:MAG: hypothetical protein VKJ64_12360 [Leptolyngbyaceae bacterium]|nr:hypothetical protein [Leptolyngbyaceae bacterium]
MATLFSPQSLPSQSLSSQSPPSQSVQPESSATEPLMFQPKGAGVRWRSLLVKTTVWLSTEIILGVMGLDNLADYSEFVLQRHMLAQMTETIAHIISSF